MDRRKLKRFRDLLCFKQAQKSPDAFASGPLVSISKLINQLLRSELRVSFHATLGKVNTFVLFFF
ncbi:MAG: hypothetical protein JXR04_04315, partial [Bermanella sp.]